MTCHPSSLPSLSPQASHESTSESLQRLKVTPDKKAGTIPGTTIATVVELSLR